MRDTGLVHASEWTIYDLRPTRLGDSTEGMYVVTVGRDPDVSRGNVVAAVRKS